MADIMTLVDYSLRGNLGVDRARLLSYLPAVFASIGYALLLSRYRLRRPVELTLIGLASLLFFKHLLYDYVLLAPVLCLALKVRRASERNILMGGVSIFWFLAFFLNKATDDSVVHLPALALNACLLATLLAYTTFVALRQVSAGESRNTPVLSGA